MFIVGLVIIKKVYRFPFIFHFLFEALTFDLQNHPLSTPPLGPHPYTHPYTHHPPPTSTHTHSHKHTHTKQSRNLVKLKVKIKKKSLLALTSRSNWKILLKRLLCDVSLLYANNIYRDDI